MKEQSGTFAGAQGIRLYTKTWLPDGEAKATLVIVHGVGEHIGRYQNLAAPLVRRGYLLAGYDQRGYGQSPGRRGYIRTWSEYRQDLAAFLTAARSLAPGRPLFIYGHSMGSLVVLDFILRDASGLSGAVISGTALDPKDAAPPHLVLAAKIISNIYPPFQMKVKLDGDGLTHDPVAARAFVEDPLVHPYRTVRWGTETLKTIKWIKAHAGQLSLPVLFVHGSQDEVVLVSGPQSFYEQVSFPDKTLIVYPGCKHEPHNEFCHAQVAEDIGNWMDKHLLSSTDVPQASPLKNEK
jgi:alpha-beta hydrolase superfamily lysophospholipase